MPEHDQKQGKRKTLPRYVTIPALAALAGMVLYMLSPIFDTFGIESLRCEVVSAKSKTSSGGSRGSASTAGVLVETSNCGKLVVSKGVTFDSRDEVAASFKAGSKYDFDLGWFSREVSIPILHGIPTVKAYRLAE